MKCAVDTPFLRSSVGDSSVQFRYKCREYVQWVAAGLRPNCLEETFRGIGFAYIQIKVKILIGKIDWHAVKKPQPRRQTAGVEPPSQSLCGSRDGFPRC